ncbi:hypothetical protein [Paractinoplanes rishiriensis]|uniref:Uncharacterized protein n=1 Tax=Paractinoplanes rishiriensis TaxID=1050105 RepID=A0A919JXI0_9ACTN|nr:hypothetical protein [Actinoplanes rishiriensis]GIE96660.1 hypothetical protein Ari01nite_41250 [Actinoplanes rishiriensis]
MRGGLDDALDKLARRDELRRRANGEAPGTPQAVTELVEAIAAVVARHPELGVTVGAEGAGEPILLHFFFTDGQVQVTADNPPVSEEVTTPRHADFEIDVEEPAESPPPATAYGYPRDPYYGESDTAERLYGSFDGPPPDPRYPAHDPGESSRDLGARLRDLGMASRVPVPPPASPPPPADYPPPAEYPPPADYPPHPFAATPPPPVPPQRQEMPESGQATRRIHAEHHRAPAEPSAAERAAPQQRNGMPAPLAKPIPLKVERPEETEMAARRLAALLRDDPSLLNQAPD